MDVLIKCKHLATEGTGTISSGSIFRPHLVRIITDLLDDVRHVTEALAHSAHPMETAADTCPTIIFWQIASGLT